MKNNNKFKIKFTLDQCRSVLEELNQIRENYPDNGSDIIATEKAMRLIERSEKIVQLGEGWMYRIGNKCIPITISYIGKAVMRLNNREVTCTLKGRQVVVDTIGNVIQRDEEIPIYSARLIPIGYKPVSKNDNPTATKKVDSQLTINFDVDAGVTGS